MGALSLSPGFTEHEGELGTICDFFQRNEGVKCLPKALARGDEQERPSPPPRHVWRSPLVQRAP